MNRLKSNNLWASVLLTLLAGLCTAWIGGWLVHDGWWLVRVAILAVSLMLTGGAAFLLERNRRREDHLAQQHFEVLWKLDTQGMYTDLSDAGLPPLSPSNPWFDLAERVRDTTMRLYRRIEELEHTQASLEVRCRRAAAQARRITRILDSLADPILAVDHFDEVILANHSAEGLLQIDMERVESKALARLVPCQKLVQLLASTRQRKAGHRTDELEITDGEGQSHWYRATAVHLAAESEDSPEDGAVAVLRDIGDQKALQKRNAEFVSSVSHEMKTPLAAVKAYVELLADGDAEDRETREEFLGVINSQTDRMQRLIDNMLNLARIEAGVVNVSKRPRSLNELLEEALRIVQPSADAKQIRLASELSPLYLGVLADRDMLLQAAVNLLSNAVKYTPSGGIVTLRSRLDDDQVRFEVQDNGVGLSDEDCRRVFERFYRVKKDQEMAAGTGLGLPLTKHVVEDVHGGSLAVESVLGQGSTFVVTLPGAGRMRAEGREKG
jgi:two-component system, OmpR family, phosphate regulon sensor histidine kinase PhoR